MSDGPEGLVIPLLEEEIAVSTQVHERGRVRIDLRTVEEEKAVDAELATSTVEIERVPADEIVDEMPEPSEENGVLVVPVVEETLVVQRKYRIVERIILRRRETTRHERTLVRLRRQQAVVERSTVSAEGDPEMKSSE